MSVVARIAFENIRQGKRRNVVLGGAIGAAALLIVLLLSFVHGLEASLMRAATTICAGHVNVGGVYKPNPDRAASLVLDVTSLSSLVRRTLPDSESITVRLRAFGTIVGPEGALRAEVQGVRADEEPRLLEALSLAEEREYKEGGRAAIVGDLRRLAEDGAAVIFVGQAKRLGVVVGDIISVKSETVRGSAAVEDFTVVAIARDLGLLGAFSILAERESLRRMYGLSSDVGSVVQVHLRDPSAAPEAMRQLRAALAGGEAPLLAHDPQPYFMRYAGALDAPWVGQRLDTSTWEDEVSDVSWIFGLFGGVSLVILLVLAVVMAVGLMNAMWIAVRERRSEIGTLRAVGMTRGGVLGLFLVEGTTLAVLASATGALCGAAIASVLSWLALPIPLEALRAVLMGDTLLFVASPTDVVVVVVSLSTVAAIAAAPPALRAAAIPPLLAIHDAG